jgi:hypothetical protein
MRFQRYVAYVLSGCCKIRSSVAYVAMTMHLCCKMYVSTVSAVSNVCASVLSGRCMHCTGYTRIVQVYVLNGSNVCCKCFMNVAYVAVPIRSKSML